MSIDQAQAVEFIDAPGPPHEPPIDGAVDAPGPKRRLWLRSLTSRLVVGVVLLVFILVVATGLSTFFALRHALYKQLDTQLTNTTHGTGILRVLSQSGGHFGTPSLPVPQTIYVVIIDNNTHKATSYQPQGQDITPLKLSSSELQRLVSKATGPTSRETTDHHWIRTLSLTKLQLSSGDPSTGLATEVPVTIVVGLSEGRLRQTMATTADIELIIGLSALIVAFLATSIGVRLSLRRLKEVTGTAREVAAELSAEGRGLDRRVPAADDDSEVGQLATSFNTMLAAVETQFAARVESEQRMRQFLADASHELRTPLTSIRGYAELARMQRASGAVEEDDNLGRIESEGTRMSRLVDDLLTLARRDAEAADDTARMEHEPVDVPSLLDEVVAGARAAFPDRPIELATGPLPAVLGDRDHLLRAIRNLVTNAAVHTAVGRPIRVAGQVEPGAVVITVADGGPGLPPEDAAHVFERFWRADKARTRARGGSGLGMSIVAAIVRAHGGTVDFASSVEHGSTATIRLPLND